MSRLYRIPRRQYPTEPDNVAQAATAESVAESEREQPAETHPDRGGFLGGDAVFWSRRNQRMIETAIRNQYPITDDIRRLIVGKMTKILATSENEIRQMNAARVLQQADALNVKREHGPRGPAQHVHLHADAKPKTLAEFIAQSRARRAARGDSPDPHLPADVPANAIESTATVKPTH